MKKWNFRKEAGRKLIHFMALSFLIIYLIIATTFSIKIALIILVAFLVFMIELEYVRIETSIKIPLLHRLYVLRRAKEKHQLGGEIFFLIGAILAFAVFDVRVAAAAVTMTVFGDLAAAIVGTRYGKTWIPKLKNRAWEGVIAELFVNLLVGFFLLRTLSGGTVWWLTGTTIAGSPLWPVIIVMAVTATVVETLISKLDDNMLIPIFSGFFGHLTLFLMQIV